MSYVRHLPPVAHSRQTCVGELSIKYLVAHTWQNMSYLARVALILNPRCMRKKLICSSSSPGGHVIAHAALKQIAIAIPRNELASS